MKQNDQRLIVISNRLPVRLRRRSSNRWSVSPSSGGLVTALDPVLRQRGGVWIGWAGTTDGAPEALETTLAEACADWRYDLVPVFLSDIEVRDFYRGFANEVVWPLFHDCFSPCNFDPRYWSAFISANGKFAERAAELARPGDVIWVHDYQLMDVGRQLRGLGIENKIGFFNHIPFPTPDIFRRLPWRERILDSLLEYDLLGFQLARDEAHFCECRADLLESPAPFGRSASRARAASSRRVGHFPISIDFDDFAKLAASESVAVLARQLRAQNRDRKILLGVDRLDYSKGLPEKLAGFRHALEKYPDLRGRVTLVQYVVPSREKVAEYRTLRLRIERAIGEINGAFSEPGWIPVHYYFQSLRREELCAYYRTAAICLITSVKDGMNLVAKEYCAAQVDDPGVLILSEFTGSASELGDDALQINPCDIEGVCDAIHQGVAMSATERSARMQRLRECIRVHDVHHWVDCYLAELAPGMADVGAKLIAN